MKTYISDSILLAMVSLTSSGRADEVQDAASKKDYVLTVHGLKVTFHTYAGEVEALDGIELSVRKGEIFGLVGESGCGKSVTSLAICGLLPPNARVEGGEAVFDGMNLLGLKKEELRISRLRDVAIVFQDPTTYLNPVLTVGSQITEIIEASPEVFTKALVESRLKVLREDAVKKTLSPELKSEMTRLESLVAGFHLSKKEMKRLAKLYAISMLGKVRLPDPQKVFNMYPFELSGGMKQRAMIAMALIRKPKIFFADEITTALDVTVQAQILYLLKELKEEINGSVILITHDLGIVAEICDRVAVMYAGNIVEVADVNELFAHPLHPYTQSLLASVPRPDVAAQELTPIKGSVPDLIAPPPGCRFHPRCHDAFDRCAQEKPSLIEASPGHVVSCFLYHE
jgi:oligopeptide/dipeptide ABC transporter ATP-binding protein